MDENKTYYLLSGVGEFGTWKRVTTTERGIRRALERERCGGYREAAAFVVEDIGEILAMVSDVETGRTRLVSKEAILFNKSFNQLFKQKEKEKQNGNRDTEA